LQLSLQLLAGRAAHPATAGLLADALHLLAVGMEDAPQRARQDLRLKQLLLFSDVAARVGGAGGVVTADLGDLLVAVAAAAEGLQPRTLRLLGSSSSSRMSMHDIQVGCCTVVASSGTQLMSNACSVCVAARALEVVVCTTADACITLMFAVNQ
jgi:hypothetical protein